MSHKVMMNKEKFMKSDLGIEMENCVRSWDRSLDELRKMEPDHIMHDYWENTCNCCGAQWEVYQLVMEQLYGVLYHFSRTDEYFGICTEDEDDWLLKVDKSEL